MRAYPPPSFVFLAFLGAEIAGGAEYAPPPGRVIIRPSPGDVLSRERQTKTELLMCFLYEELHHEWRSEEHLGLSSLMI